MNPNTVLPNTPQPSLAQALRDFDRNYGKRYGQDKLPEGHGNVEYALSPDFRERLPTHRKRTYDEAVTASGRPQPGWPPKSFWWTASVEDEQDTLRVQDGVCSHWLERWLSKVRE